MANRERNKRSARKARAAERAELEAKQASEGTSSAKAPVAKAQAAKPAKKEAKRTGIFGRLVSYLKEVRSEVKRVVWPSKTELKNYSIAVIGMLIVFGLVVWALDSGIVAALVGYTGLRG